MQAPERWTIEVTGEGTALAVPDVVRVVLGVELHGAAPAPAQDEARRTMQAVISAVQATGVPADAIRTVDYSVQARREVPPRPGLSRERERERVFYVVTHLVEVKLRELDRTGAIVDAALAAGANLVRDVAFVVEDLRGPLATARERAMRDARERAEQLARLGGVLAGLPIRIVEGSVARPLRQPFAAKTMAAETASFAPTPIEACHTEVSVTVTVTYPIRHPAAEAAD